MPGHTNIGGPEATQNQGNVLGDRPCVRQSKLYRQQCGGNAMKEMLGQDNLKWDIEKTQGAYEGGRVYDHNRDCPVPTAQTKTMEAPTTAAVQAPPPVNRRGASNRSSYNLIAPN
eukprot:Tbor_TRINITY_DN4243_c0_g1::TRINITY_DN4243_c0_g1_i1::g.23944::m.23944